MQQQSFYVECIHDYEDIQQYIFFSNLQVFYIGLAYHKLSTG